MRPEHVLEGPRHGHRVLQYPLRECARNALSNWESIDFADKVFSWLKIVQIMALCENICNEIEIGQVPEIG